MSDWLHFAPSIDNWYKQKLMMLVLILLDYDEHTDGLDLYYNKYIHKEKVRRIYSFRDDSTITIEDEEER